MPRSFLKFSPNLQNSEPPSSESKGAYTGINWIGEAPSEHYHTGASCRQRDLGIGQVDHVLRFVRLRDDVESLRRGRARGEVALARDGGAARARADFLVGAVGQRVVRALAEHLVRAGAHAGAHHHRRRDLAAGVDVQISLG